MSEETPERSGEQDVSPAPKLRPGQRLVEATGAPVKVFRLHEGGVMRTFGLESARALLSVPEREPVGLVEEIIHLLAEGSEDGPSVAEEPSYAWRATASGQVIATQSWVSGLAGATWAPVADISERNGRPHVTGYVELDATRWGLEEHTEALTNLVLRLAERKGVETPEERARPLTGEGKVIVPFEVGFAADALAPSIIANTMHDKLSTLALDKEIAQAKKGGALLSDTALATSRKVSGKAVAYAAINGRTPKDSEIAAVLSAFNVDVTLRRGFQVERVTEETFEAYPPQAKAAFVLWLRNYAARRDSGQLWGAPTAGGLPAGAHQAEGTATGHADRDDREPVNIDVPDVPDGAAEPAAPASAPDEPPVHADDHEPEERDEPTGEEEPAADMPDEQASTAPARGGGRRERGLRRRLGKD